MDALPPAPSWADHSPSLSPLTATSAILSTPGTMASKRVDGARAEDAGAPKGLLRWLAGALLSIMARWCPVSQQDAAAKKCDVRHCALGRVACACVF